MPPLIIGICHFQVPELELHMNVSVWSRRGDQTLPWRVVLAYATTSLTFADSYISSVTMETACEKK